MSSDDSTWYARLTQNQDGLIDRDAIKGILSKNQSNVCEALLDSIIAEVDLDKDGKVAPADADILRRAEEGFCLSPDLCPIVISAALWMPE